MEKKNILERLPRLGFDTLNPMQQKVVENHDKRLIILSPTGSGKTAAFVIRMLMACGAPKGEVQAVVIAPSRELVLQIADVTRALAQGLKVGVFYGGHSVKDEVSSIEGSVPDIVIATPGRLLDHTNRKNLDISHTSVLVLDEYDKALDLGFQDDMRKIVRQMTSLKEVILTSATELEEIPRFAGMDTARVLDFTQKTQSPRSRMELIEVPSAARDKLDTLVDLLKALPNEKVLVFVNHREAAERVHQRLVKDNLPAGLYHGALDQQQREIALMLLANGTTPILVCTDLGARGLDIPQVGSIVHYHLPVNEEAWTHRNGRTARVDASGKVYVIVSEADSIADYIHFDRSWTPNKENPDGIRSEVATLYINAGKKLKISRGDVLGYVIQKGNLESSEIGKIVVMDRYSLVAVPRQKADQVAKELNQYKIKNVRVRVSVLED